MPTGKAPKHTRKLKQRQANTNRRRVAKGKKPLGLNRFYGISRKNTKTDRSERGNQNEGTKKKQNNEEPFEEKDIFGFGDEMDAESGEVMAFAQDMQVSESESQDDDIKEMGTSENDNENENENEMGSEVTSIERTPYDKLKTRETELTSEILKHQSDLQQLKEMDPEFYQHLKSVDDSILDFGSMELSQLGDDEGTLKSNLSKIEGSQMGEIANEFEENNNDYDNDDGFDEPPRKRQRLEARETREKKSNKMKDKTAAFLENDSDDSDDLRESDDSEDFFANESDTEHYIDGDIVQETIEKSIFEMSCEELKELIAELDKEKSITALRRIMTGFCGFVQMCVVNEEEDEKNDGKSGKSKQAKSKERSAKLATQLAMASNPAFQDLVRYCMTKLAPCVPAILEIDSKQQNNIDLLKKNKKVSKNFGWIRRYFKSVYVFLTSVSDEMMQRLILIHLKQLNFIFLLLNDNNQRLFIKRVCHLWSSGSATVRIDAFLFLHEIGQKMKSKALLKLYKFMYQSFVTVCKRVSLKTMAGINFMINCMDQMYSINCIVAYQEAFHRLRAIAFHVKQGIQIMSKHHWKGDTDKERTKKHSAKLKQSKDDIINSIYNWRFINLIRLWGKVIGSQVRMRKSDLHLLIYPFVQIVCSVLTLSRSHQLNPARLKLITCLIDLIENCQKCNIDDRRVFVPLVPYLITMMSNPAFAKASKKDNIKNSKNSNSNDNENGKEEDEKEEIKIDLRFKLKTAGADFGTAEYHSSLMDSITRLMMRYFASYSYELSFPELSFPVLMFIKDFLSNANIPTYLKSNARLLHRKLHENSEWIDSKRKNVQFSPKDFQAVYAFLHHERNEGLSPLSKFLKSKQYASMSHLPDAPKSKQTKLGKTAMKQQKQQNSSKKSRHKAQNKSKQQRKRKLGKDNSDVVEQLVLSD